MNNNNRVGAIVQARMSSERLPGKVLMEILGRPMLWHLVNRLKYTKLINKIIIAATTSKKDDVIDKFCEANKIITYRGDENDVLDRYYQAAKIHDVGVVVRITADCPMIDPFVVDKVISAYLNNKNNFCGASNVIKRTYPRGLDTEVFSFSALKKTWGEAKAENQREHPTLYIYEHPEIFKLISVENSRDLSDLRWTVDEDKDFIFVNEIYKRLYKDGAVFFMPEVLGLLKEDPRLEEINRGVKQKSP